jgi:hypothetical protein
MFTGFQEQELAEIKALTYELGESTQLVLKRIREARGLLAAHGPLLAFVHIPKTAGATATTMFARVYSKSGVHPAGNFIKGPEKTARKVVRRPGGWETWHRRGGRVTVGHVPYGLFREHLPADTRYMTFLREPVDRVLSHYYRHIHQPDVSRANRLERRREGKDRAASLEEALAEPPLPQISNLATRFLCGHPSPMGELPPSALDDAKANLREFAFVGLQERFEESVVLLQRTLGLELIPYLNRHVSLEGHRPAVEEISDAERALIVECNRLDVELYGFGLGLFENAVLAADEQFAADVEALRATSADVNEEAIQKARDWLDRELPAGTTKPTSSVRLAAKAAGVPIPALKQVLGSRRDRSSTAMGR